MIEKKLWTTWIWVCLLDYIHVTNLVRNRISCSQTTLITIVLVNNDERGEGVCIRKFQHEMTERDIRTPVSTTYMFYTISISNQRSSILKRSFLYIYLLICRYDVHRWLVSVFHYVTFIIVYFLFSCDSKRCIVLILVV